MRQFTSRVVVLAFLAISAAFAAPFIEVQPVIVNGATSLGSLNTDITYTQAIFAQIGLEVHFFTPLTSTTLPDTMDTSSSPSQNIASYIFDSNFQPYPILTAWWVSSIAPGAGVRGVSWHVTTGTDEYYGIGIASAHAVDTLAHEIAHILTGFQALYNPAPSDGAHSADPNNLLAGGPIRILPTGLGDIGTVDRIEPIQAQTMLNSPFIIPEPATYIGMASGLIAIGVWRRRRAA